MHDHNTPTQESYTSKCTLMQSQMIMYSHNTLAPTADSKLMNVMFTREVSA